MNTNVLVDKLLRGSRNIDRMKAEVNQLVKMVIGFAFRSNARGASMVEINEVFENEWCRWEVEGVMGHLDKDSNEIVARCTLKLRLDPPNQDHFIQTIGYHSKGYVPFHSDHAQQVYQNLHVFIEGMIKTLPDIKELMEPLLKASEVF